MNWDNVMELVPAPVNDWVDARLAAFGDKVGQSAGKSATESIDYLPIVLVVLAVVLLVKGLP